MESGAAAAAANQSKITQLIANTFFNFFLSISYSIQQLYRSSNNQLIVYLFILQVPRSQCRLCAVILRLLGVRHPNGTWQQEVLLLT